MSQRLREKHADAPHYGQHKARRWLDNLGRRGDSLPWKRISPRAGVYAATAGTIRKHDRHNLYRVYSAAEGHKGRKGRDRLRISATSGTESYTLFPAA